MAALVGFVCAGAATPAYAQDAVSTTKLYETTIPRLGGIEAAPVQINVNQESLIILASSNGNIVAVEADAGDEKWRVKMPTPEGEFPHILATPAKVGKLLFVSYAATSNDAVRQRHLVSVVDLHTGELAEDFPTLELNASKPANDGGTVAFNPPTASSHAALVHAGRPDGSRGMLYISFGNSRDIQPWHGWIFEVDIDAWKRDGVDAAVTAVLLTTPESQCPVEGESGGNDMICGAGVWNFAGPQVIEKGGSYELLATTGNGELNLNDNNYANSVLRLTNGLDFDPECNPEKCADFDPIAPAEQCLRSCRNIAIPRLLPGDPPLRVATGGCDGLTFLECYARNDWDLGASGAVQTTLGPGTKVIVQPGKDGALYLFDAKKMGHLYDRKQIIEPCGVPGDDCRGSQWMGTIKTQPVVVKVDGEKVVITPTFMPNGSQPAGVVATKLLNEDGRPRLEVLWKAPSFDSQEAIDRFRANPSLPILTKSPEGERYVWVVDPTGAPATLVGVRVADGTIVVRQPLQGGDVDMVRPLHHRGVLYVTSRLVGATQGENVVEAFRINY